MTTQAPGNGDFVANVGKIYGVYAGGVVAFLIVLAILEQVGVADKIIGYLFVCFTLLIYAGIGILSRTMHVSEFYVAGRSVPAIYNGMAVGADGISGVSFLAMTGTLYVLGYDGLAFVLGWTGGFVLVAVLIAPYLRKSGAYTVPDFLASRFGGIPARLIGVIILLAASLLFVVAQIRGAGLITERFLDIPYEQAVYVVLAGILLCSLLGGMRAVTWTQVGQYIVLIIAFLVPAIWMSFKQYGVPLPQIMYGRALQDIAALEAAKPALVGAKSHLAPFAGNGFWSADGFSFFALIVCLMFGTAAMPNILMRYFTTESVREARRSVSWSLAFIALLYVTAPAYAAFVKLEVFQNVIGQSFADLPNWVYVWGQTGSVTLCGAAASSLDAVQAACAGKDAVLYSDFSIARDIVVLASPEIAGLPFVITALVGAGALTAALSTADGLILSMANALSFDVYYRLFDRKAPTSRRLFFARIILIAVAVVSTIGAVHAPPDILGLVAWAFSLAAAGNFPALVLGIWWKRCTSAGAICGMIAGFGSCLAYLFYTAAPPFGLGNAPIFGVSTWTPAVFGLPIGFVVTILISLVTPRPSLARQDFIDAMHIPRGDTLTHSGDDALLPGA